MIVALIVGVAIVYQVLSSDIDTRLKEYATLKAMGYTRRYLSVTVLKQALLLAVGGFIPGVMRPELLDGILQVAPDDAMSYARRAAREEGMLVGVSSGASLAAVAQLLPQVADGARILTFAYDTGERYLSVEALWG